jgi:hypothetical protein
MRAGLDEAGPLFLPHIGRAGASRINAVACRCATPLLVRIWRSHWADWFQYGVWCVVVTS